MNLMKCNYGGAFKMKHKSKFAALLLVTAISSQSVSIAFAANGVDQSAIDPKSAAYGYYVDVYKNNSSSNKTPVTNPSIGVLSGFLNLWTPGATWDTGTKLNTSVLDANIQKVASITSNSTAAQKTQAYLDDRRNQNYSIITGLGSYTDNFITGANATTSVTDVIPANATTVKYDDTASAWADENSSLGNIVKLVNMVRNSSASTSSAKAYYQYMRPYRWNTAVSVIPNLVPCISPTPASDGGFPSGHTNAGYLASLSLAYAVPQRFQEMLTRASDLGNNRVIAGMHSCFDVIGGRMTSTAIVASALNDPANAALKQSAYTQAQSTLLTQTGTSVDKYSGYATNLKNYTDRLTYGFAQTGDTTKAMVVPKGAEVLLETRLPYLDATQRRWVLYSTGLASGYPVLDDVEGWGRLNLFAAANGYGAMNNDVTVTMDASKGGYNASDNWKNDISGSGTLTKQGTGTLILSGNNTYTGGTVLAQGILEADSSKAFGTGNVSNNGGTISENVPDSLTIKGNFSQSQNGTLELNIDSSDDLLNITGEATLGGTLKLNFVNNYVPDVNTAFISYGTLTNSTAFSSVQISGLSDSYKVAIDGTSFKIVSANAAATVDPAIITTPKTGDTFNLALYVLLFIGSVSTSAIVMINKKRVI
ncbi:acid phosphatase [[Clostridium] fimetarium]|uniref:Autotransporter-associated beta strand repeat-containing protein n=1 Tax=[Clostridium] fimetarium TaxID=99656 RepID=A0A1I0R6D6_9FIRM|nr:phosphatase PAP2 family protein [[Clostridium] fimetarium]SEW35965.1 autotransporter-associated beta strand repeat-containing protein [[Clostridium] fimetarium]